VGAPEPEIPGVLSPPPAKTAMVGNAAHGAYNRKIRAINEKALRILMLE